MIKKVKRCGVHIEHLGEFDMDDLMIQNQDNALAISTEATLLIQSSVVPNTIAAYRRATQKLKA